MNIVYFFSFDNIFHIINKLLLFSFERVRVQLHICLFSFFLLWIGFDVFNKTFLWSFFFWQYLADESQKTSIHVEKFINHKENNDFGEIYAHSLHYL